MVFVFPIYAYAAEEFKTEFGTLPENFVYRDYADADLIKLADLLYHTHRHSEAVEACKEALNRNLTDDKTASVKHVLAETYEAMSDHGQDAKDTYLQIIQGYPTYEKFPEVAYRLGELNICIIPKGTEPDNDKAVEYLKMVIDRLPIVLSGETNVTYLSLKAHMMLGNLLLGQGHVDEARQLFRTIYDCDINKAVVLPYETFATEQETQEHLAWSKDRILNMKKRIPRKLVSACVSSDLGLSMQRLSELQCEYPDNTEIQELISDVLKKLAEVEEVVDQEIANSTS